MKAGGTQQAAKMKLIREKCEAAATSLMPSTINIPDKEEGPPWSEVGGRGKGKKRLPLKQLPCLSETVH